jgi:hypothetical protein
MATTDNSGLQKKVEGTTTVLEGRGQALKQLHSVTEGIIQSAERGLSNVAKHEAVAGTYAATSRESSKAANILRGGDTESES